MTQSPISKLMNEEKAIENNIDSIAEKIHNYWINMKKSDGSHSPDECDSLCATERRELGGLETPDFNRYCDKCNTSMYPYKYLPEEAKDASRNVVSALVKVINNN